LLRTTIRLRVHARPLTPALSPGGGEGDDCSEHEGELKVIVDKLVGKISIYPHPLIHFNDLIESG
jgi:hypothetical protein